MDGAKPGLAGVKSIAKSVLKGLVAGKRRAAGALAALVIVPAMALPAEEARADSFYDWVVNISDSPDPVPVNGTVTYLVTVTNSDVPTDTAPATVLTLDIPAGAEFTGATSPLNNISGCTPAAPVIGPGTVTCNVAPLAGGRTYTLAATVKATEVGVLDITASVPTASDVQPENNSATELTTVTIGTDLKLGVESLPPGTVVNGSLVTYRFTVANLGPELPPGSGQPAATNVSVRIPKPAGLDGIVTPPGCTLAPPPANAYSCVIPGPIPVNGAATINLTGQVAAAAPSTVTVSGSITASNPPDPIASNNNALVSTSVTTGSDVKIVKDRTPSTGIILVGQEVTFTLTASYTGDSPNTLQITDTIPASYQIDEVITPANWTCSQSGPDDRTVTCDRPSGPPGSGFDQLLGVVTIKATAIAAGDPQDTTNSATITTTSSDPIPENNTDTDGGAAIRVPELDLSSSKTCPSIPLVVEGNTYPFTLRASNTGNLPFSGTMQLVDTLPAGLQLSSISNANGWSCSPVPSGPGPVEIICERIYAAGSELLPGQNTPAVTLNATVLPGAPSSITNEVTVRLPDGAPLQDAQPGNDSDSCEIGSFQPGKSADIEVIKTASEAQVKAGDTQTFTIKVANNGPSPVSTLDFTDKLEDLINSDEGPTGAGLVSLTVNPNAATGFSCATAATDSKTRTLTCEFDASNPADETTFFPVCNPASPGDCPEIEVTVRPGGNGEMRTNVAKAYANIGDPNLDNNEGKATYEVTPAADIQVTKTGTPDPVKAGQDLIYVVTAKVTDDGLSEASNVVVTDTLPDGLTFISAVPFVGGPACSTTPIPGSTTSAATNNNVVACNLGTIGNGSQQTVTITVRPNLSLRGQTIVNTADVETETPQPTGPDTTPNSDSVQTTVEAPRLDLQITKTDDPDPVTLLEETTYTITVQNNGPSDSENVEMVDTLPNDGFSFVAVSDSAGFSCSGVNPGDIGGTLTCTRPRLNAGTSAAIKVRMKSIKKGVFINGASVTSDEIRQQPNVGDWEGPIRNNAVLQATTVIGRVDLEVTSKVPSVNPVGLLVPFNYTILVQNKPGQDLTEADVVSLNDSLPQGMVLNGTPTWTVTEGTASGGPGPSNCSGTAGDTSFDCGFGTVSNPGKIAITVPVKVVAVTSSPTQTFVNTAEVKTTSRDIDLSNNRKDSENTTVESATLSGFVYRDFDNNGTKDTVDTGINNVPVTLTGTATQGGSAIGPITVNTNASGQYTFSGLPAGTYKVTRGSVTESYLVDGKATPGTDTSSPGTAVDPNEINSIGIVVLNQGINFNFGLVPTARIGIAKQAGTVTVNADGSVNVPFTLRVKNHSLEPVKNVKITDVLAGATPAFGTYTAGVPTDGQYTIYAAPAATPNSCTGAQSSFNGSSNTTVFDSGAASIAAGATCNVTFTVRVRPVSPLPTVANGGRYQNQAEVEAVGVNSGQDKNYKPGNATVSQLQDLSDNGNNTDANNNGISNEANENDKTPVNFNYSPSIDVTKSADTGDFSKPAVKAGDTVTYVIRVRNTGNVNLTQVALTDQLKNGANTSLTLTSGPTFNAGSDAGSDGILSPNETWSYDATYDLTQSDVNSASLTNTAAGEFKPPYGANVTDDGSVTTPLQAAPSIALVKTADVTNVSDPAAIGEEITYSFTVTNTGNVTLTDITLTDPKVSIPPNLTIASLAPGESDNVTFKASYILKQEDLDARKVTNTATVTGKTPAGGSVTDTSGTAADNNEPTEVPLNARSGLSLTKDGEWIDANTSAAAEEGEKISYTYKVTNTGTVTLTSVSVTELAAPAFTGTGTPPVPAFGSADQGSPAGTLKPGETATYTADYVLTQADIDAGKVDNQAATAGETQTGEDVSDKSRPTGAADDGPTTVELPAAPAITLVKTADAAGVSNPAKVGEEISYSFTVTNTGNVTLKDITLEDNFPGVTLTGGPIEELAPGASNSTTFTATYAIKQADINAGKVQNSATVTGTPPVGDKVTDISGTEQDNDTPTEVLLGTTAGIALVKSGVYSDSANTTTPGKPEAGDIITYTYQVTNTGNLTLTGVDVTELQANFTGKGNLPDPVFVHEAGGPVEGTLQPGETATYTAEYTLTQEDVDAGFVDNQASTQGTPPQGQGDPVKDLSHPTDQDEDGPTKVDLTQLPGITLLKTVISTTVTEPAKLGQTITYGFTVTNTGNVTLTDVTVKDPMVTVEGGPITLEPNETNSTTFKATYTIDQDDLNAGQVVNTAGVTAQSPAGEVTDDSHPEDTAADGPTIVPLVTEPKLSIIKEGVFNDANNDGGATDGETITYTFTVTNTGNVTLKTVDVTELSFSGTNTAPTPDWQSASLNSPEGTLEPGETATYTAEYSVSGADIAAGKVTNQAEAEGTPDVGNPVSDKSHPTDGALDGLTEVPLIPPGKIAAVKTSEIVKDVAPPGLSAGDTLRYTITVTNTGGVALANVRISSDDLSRLTSPPQLITDYDETDFSPASVPSLAPQDSTDFIGDYTVTQADVDAGGLSNTAVATGFTGTREVSDTSGTDIENDEPTVTPVTRQPAMTLKKTGKVSGDKVAYSFVATNTGNVTLFNVEITEQQGKFSGTGPLPEPEYASGGATIDGFGENNDLAPGASVTWTASYTMTKQDIANGHVDNVALAEAQDFEGDPVSAEGGTRVSVKLIDLVEDELNDILSDHLQGLITVESGRFNSFARKGAERLRSPEECKDDDPNHVNGGFLIETVEDGITLSADANVHKPLTPCAERTRYILDSELDVRHFDGDTTATASLTLLRETLVDDDTLFGQFFGGYLDLPSGDGGSSGFGNDDDDYDGFDGSITGIGLHAGIYGAQRLKDDLVLDGYLAASIGRQTFDLTVGGDLEILAEGESRYAAGYAGAGISGAFFMGGYAFEPRASIDAAYALPWMESLDLSLEQNDQSATMDLDEIGLVRSTIETRMSPDEDEPGGFDWAATPKGFCQYNFGHDADLSCGVGLGLELGYLNEEEDREIRIAIEGEVAEDYYLGSGSIRYIWYHFDKRANSEFMLGLSAEGGAEAVYTFDFKL